MKVFLLTLSALFTSISLFAQSKSCSKTDETHQMQNEWRLSTSYGINMEVSPASRNLIKYVGNRDKVVFGSSLIAVQYLSKHRWGVECGLNYRVYSNYGDIYYDDKKENNDLGEAFINAFGDALVSISSLFLTIHKFGVHVDALYRIDTKSWYCYPKLGVNVITYSYENQTSHLRKNEYAIQREHPAYSINGVLGAELGYKVSKRINLFVMMNYQHPLNRLSGSTTISKENGPSVKITSYKNEKPNSTMDFELGISFRLGKIK